VQHTLRKSEILRGYSVFSDVLKNGESIHGSALHCYVRKKKRGAGAPAVLTGFTVPRRDVPLAVDRNKLKRLMREAFRTNKMGLCEAVQKTDLQLSIVFLYKQKRGTDVWRVHYTQVENELKDMTAKIISIITRNS
jgi:ribonuclease P protein component